MYDQNGMWCSIVWCVCACISLIVSGNIMTIFLKRSRIDEEEDA